MGKEISIGKNYEDYDIGTFDFENKVDSVCREMSEKGIDPELISKVSDIGIEAADAFLNLQVLEAAVEDTCNEKELALIGKTKAELKHDYESRMLDEEQIEALEDYCPGFVDANPGVAVLDDAEIESYFEEGRRLWGLDKDGAIWAPTTVQDALEFKKSGGLVITTAFMAEKDLRDIASGRNRERD